MTSEPLMSNRHQSSLFIQPFGSQKSRKPGEFQERDARPPAPLDKGGPSYRSWDVEPDDLAIAFSAGGEARATKRGAHNFCTTSSERWKPCARAIRSISTSK